MPMVQYRALRVVRGDFGTIHPGGVFEVPDFMAKKLERLEANGVITRYRPRPQITRPAYTVLKPQAKTVENKAVHTRAQ